MSASGRGRADHVLILAGTSEARRLAELPHPGQESDEADKAEGNKGNKGDGAGNGAVQVTVSPSGRVARPARLPGTVRIGGLGGPEGLAHWMREQRVTALIDATHPFAHTVSLHAASAAATTHVPLLALRRPGWAPGPGDLWHETGSPDEPAGMPPVLPVLGERVFLTTGRTSLAAFAGLRQLRFLARCVDAPGPPLPPRVEVLLDRGPYAIEGERELLRRHRVDVLVTKDSGGSATVAKLTAAREAGLPVVVRRPPGPEGVPVAETAEEAAG